MIVLCKNNLLAVPLMGTGFLRANRGMIKFKPDFTVYLNNQLDKTVGAHSNLLGDVMPTQPTSAYAPGNILASHTSLDQVDACYASSDR